MTFVVLMLCITLGPSLKSISVGLAIIMALVTPVYRQDLRWILAKPLTWAVLALCGLVLLACTWSIASFTQQFAMLEKYCKLFYLPLFAVGFVDKKIRYYGIHAYLLGMLITCLISFYIYWFTLPPPDDIFDPGKIFYNHIITGYMIAFAAYLAAWLGIHTPLNYYKLGYGLLVALFSIQVLLINIGRTGYVIYAVLFFLLFVQHFSMKIVRYSMLAVAISGVILVQQLSPDMLLQRIGMVKQDLQAYQSGHRDSNLGFRLQFHHYAKSLFLTKPILGYGTGSFTPKYFNDNPIPAWELEPGHPLPNPHSQYWLMASEFGILGIAAFLILLGVLSQMSFYLKDMKPILHAVLLPFFIANFSDSLLVNTGIGYVFIAFAGLCLGEFIELYRPNKTQYNASNANAEEYAIG